MIHDQSDAHPYKARLILDIQQDELSSWVATELQTYIDAVKEGKTDLWLLNRGCSESYVNLKLDHKSILLDQVLSRYGEFERTVYECDACGRLHVESADNQFFPYSPDSSKKMTSYRALLRLHDAL